MKNETENQPAKKPRAARPLRKSGPKGLRTFRCREGRAAGDDLPLAQFVKQFNARADAWLDRRGAR
jgi:hypothetical protein